MIPARNAASPRLQFAHVLAEIRLRRFAKPANRKAAAIAQINVVCVKLENLLFGETLIQLVRHQNFFCFAAPFALGREEERPRHLHVDRARAFGLLPAAHVVKRRSKYANHVQRTMIEEALVLGGQHRIEQHLRNILIPNNPPFFARFIEKVGN